MLRWAIMLLAIAIIAVKFGLGGAAEGVADIV